MLCVGWSAVRVIIISGDQTAPERQAVAIATLPTFMTAKAAEPRSATAISASDGICCSQSARPIRRGSTWLQSNILATSSGSFAVPDFDARVASDVTRPATSGPAHVISGHASPAGRNVPVIRHRGNLGSLRTDAYAYSFWRGGSGGRALAAGGQYGGSQSGLIATFSLQDGEKPGRPPTLALLLRAAVAHDNVDEREVALGVRWKPLEKLPVSVTTERRFRHDREDAFAIYAAGGVSDVSLPLKFRAESFAQAGVVSGKQAGPFVDAFVRADRNVFQTRAVQVHAGAGAWAGGQRGAARLDIGPSLRTEVAIHDARIRINVDWRFRIAGDAKPGNGPAFTLSTGF